jgi:hypothetical protein
MAYRIRVRLKSGETAIGRNLYDGLPPPYGAEIEVPLTRGDTVEVRIGHLRTKGSKSGEIDADEI